MNYIALLPEQIWDFPLISLLLGTGTFLTLILFFPQIRYFFHAIRVVTLKYIKVNPELLEQPSSFLALCRQVSAPIGLGSIAGVTIAITTGGPGAVFWMWVAGFVGMSLKFASITLSVIHRESIYKIGPMYTMKHGLPRPLGHILAIFFSIFAICVALTSGNLFQANQVALILDHTWKIPPMITGIALSLFVLFILLGKKQRITDFLSKFAPTIVLFYTLGSFTVIFQNFTQFENIFFLIWKSALGTDALMGGLAGLGFKEVLSIGVRRAIFSNEAGLGSVAMNIRPIEANAVQEGLVGMIGPFIDTVIVSTMTAYVLILSGIPLYDGGIQGVDLTAKAFATYFGLGGTHLITLLVTFFAFSTMIAWSELGERALHYLTGGRGSVIYKIIFSSFLLLGTLFPIALILDVSDIFLGLMAIPNLLTLIWLSPEVFKRLRKYRRDLKAQRI